MKVLLSKEEVAAILGLTENMISLKHFVGISHDNGNGIKVNTNRSLFLQKLQIHLEFSEEKLKNPTNVKQAIFESLTYALEQLTAKYEAHKAANAPKPAAPGAEPLPA
jgi:hypothetical protein